MVTLSHFFFLYFFLVVDWLEAEMICATWSNLSTKEESLKLTKGQALSRLLFQRHLMPSLGSFSILSICIFQILITSYYLYLNYRTTVIILMVLYSFLTGVYSLQIFVDCCFSLLVIVTAGQIPQKIFASICGVLKPSSVSYFFKPQWTLSSSFRRKELLLK